MSELGERASALLERQDALRAELHLVLAEAGSHLLEKPADVAGIDLVEIRQRERDVTAQTEAVGATRDRILAIEDRQLQLKEQSATIQAEMRRLSDGIEPIYEEIGRIAFDVYRGNPLVDQEYADIFTPLVEVNSELVGIDASMNEQQSLLEEKPFLEKMVIRGRIALLKNRRTTREGSLRRLVRKAGKDIVGTAFVDEIGDPTLTAAAEPYRDRLLETREREAELTSVTEEQRLLSEELEQLGAGKRPHKKCEELNEDLSILTQTGTSIRAELAAAVRSVPGTEVPAKCREAFKAADLLQTRVEAAAAIYDRVMAALEVERLENEIERLNGEVQARESRQAELKREAAALKREVKAAESLLEEKRAARGSGDLLADDLLDGL